jgi:chloramphenicol-sensitive protein RarD
VEAALGYYVNPLLTVALGVMVLGERLRRPQVVALAFGAGSVVVLTVALGRPPWIALVLAASFGGYGFQKKAVRLPAAASLAVETALLAPIAVVGLAIAELRGSAALGNGSVGRDVLLVSLGFVLVWIALAVLALDAVGTARRRVPAVAVRA